jgi:FSR family fosmidomycin resistance protein-like MFS transporter
METQPVPSVPRIERDVTLTKVLFALSFSHLLNDTLQALLPALYPLLKESFQLSFTQIGLITFVFQVTASLLQPLVGISTDRKPLPYSLAIGMGITLVGLVLLSQAATFPVLLAASALIGTGSSIFHPEASRLARLASGGRHGFAQSLFQVGGNLGSSLGPLAAAWVVVPHGQAHVLWFSLVALLGIVVLANVGRWYAQTLHVQRTTRSVKIPAADAPFSRRRTVLAVLVLMALIFSKYFYLTSLGNYYTFYLIGQFGVSVQTAQIYLFVFLFAIAAGTILGGPLGDRFGRKWVIWISILGTAPFSLALPYAGLHLTVALTVVIGVILASAFSAILVYAQELVPGKVGLVAGLFFGFAFGVAGIGSALLGKLADHTSINYVFKVCSFLPLIGLLTAFLPNTDPRRR